MKIYKAAMYVRLSKKDEDRDGVSKYESDSVVNQKLLIEGFIKGKDDLVLAGEYIDDGFTGTNFDRPKMKEMLADIDAGKIDCVVVKDLSRFGRERVETGIYIARTFKEKGVRFIAINDDYDTLTADGAQTHIIMPIKALTNDSFSRDISMKIRSSQKAKRKHGESVCAFAPYGYQKDESVRNHLVPDEYAAGIVRDIFSKKISGYSAAAIAEELNELGILSPAEYKKSKGQKYSTAFGSGRKAMWSANTVIRIMKNEVYIGNLVQGKRERISYKVRKDRKVSQSEWIRCEGTHEGIVSRMDFDTVQDLLKRDTIRRRGGRESYMYAGILYCEKCGHGMIRRNDPRNPDKPPYYICSTHNKQEHCLRHGISEEKLNDLVMDFLQKYISRLSDVQQMAEDLKSVDVSMEAVKSHDKEIMRLKAQQAKYGRVKGNLYRDFCDGLITEGEYEDFQKDYERAEREIEEAIRRQENLIETIYDRRSFANLRLDHIRKNLSIGGIDRGVLVTFIDRIIVDHDGGLEFVARFADVVGKVEDLHHGEKKEPV